MLSTTITCVAGAESHPHSGACGNAKPTKAPTQDRRSHSKDGWMDGWLDGWMDGWMDGDQPACLAIISHQSAVGSSWDSRHPHRGKALALHTSLHFLARRKR